MTHNVAKSYEEVVTVGLDCRRSSFLRDVIMKLSNAPIRFEYESGS